jgi:hypothetical protein
MEMNSLEHPNAEQQRRQRGRKRRVSVLVRRVLQNRHLSGRTLVCSQDLEAYQGNLRRHLGVHLKAIWQKIAFC